MGRCKYRHSIRILRRQEGGAGGGYDLDAYVEVGLTSAQVRDESEAEFNSAESARVEHVKTFTMRPREIREDDLIVWHGDSYRVRRVDAFTHKGREIRVKAAVTKSKYTVVAADGQA